MLGAAVGCQGPDKTPSASLPPLPPPRLPASTTTTPKSTTQTGSTATPIDNRPGRNPAVPAAESPRAAIGAPTTPGGAFGSIDAPVLPSQNGNFRTPVSATATGSGGSWTPNGLPTITPAGSTTDLPTTGGPKNPAPADVPQPPAPPPMAVTPPTAAPVPPPALPTGTPAVPTSLPK